MPAPTSPDAPSTSFETLRRQLPIKEENSSAFYFPPLWGLFEQAIFNKDFDSKQVKAWSENVYASPVTTTWMHPEFVYFKNRYRLVDGQFTSEWIFKLGFYGKGRAVTFAHEVSHDMLTEDGLRVEEILRKIQATVAEQIEALVLIVHRVRNNFFHGEKDLYEIADQVVLLERCNTILSRLIDDFRALGCELQNVAKPPSATARQNAQPRIIKVARRRTTPQL